MPPQVDRQDLRGSGAWIWEGGGLGRGAGQYGQAARGLGTQPGGAGLRVRLAPQLWTVKRRGGFSREGTHKQSLEEAWPQWMLGDGVVADMLAPFQYCSCRLEVSWARWLKATFHRSDLQGDWRGHSGDPGF